MILSDHATTGDGTLAALQLLAEMVISEKPASELLHQFDPVPQLLKNVRFAGGKPLEAADVQAAIAEGEAMLAGRGRLVDRKRPKSEPPSLKRLSYYTICIEQNNLTITQ